MIVTAIPTYNCPLREFAANGFASCELDTKTDSFASWRGYVPPTRRAGSGGIGEAISFAKYHYKWNNEDFILYTVLLYAAGIVQYVLKERRDSEDTLGPSKAVDALIQAIGDWRSSIVDVIWVYDNYWRPSRELWEEVQKASWDNVILDESMKKELTDVAHKFFDSKDVYEDLGVPWKRGLLFHGPPGKPTHRFYSVWHLLISVILRKRQDYLNQSSDAHSIRQERHGPDSLRQECPVHIPHRASLRASQTFGAMHARPRGHRDDCDAAD